MNNLRKAIGMMNAKKNLSIPAEVLCSNLQAALLL